MTDDECDDDDLVDNESPDAALARFFRPRPRKGYWFPNLKFNRKRNWNMVVGIDVEIEFCEDITQTLSCKGSRMLTIMVQSQGAEIWPDGIRHHALGSHEFTPGMLHGHDAKRGVSIDSTVARESPPHKA